MPLQVVSSRFAIHVAFCIATINFATLDKVVFDTDYTSALSFCTCNKNIACVRFSDLGNSQTNNDPNLT